MNIISWNINGINACVRKGLLEFMAKENADIYCFQEIKASKEKIPLGLQTLDYHKEFFFAEKNGYSGTAVFSKQKPKSIRKGIGIAKFDSEGRVIVAEFDKFYLLNIYFPHSGRELKRLGFKLEFNSAIDSFVKKLKKPVIIASDFNVAHKEIDLANPKQNVNNAGFLPEERGWFDGFLKSGYIDSFREFESGNGNYTWWTYRNNARARNIGWRVDYFVISKSLIKNLIKSEILPEVMGSDHCPIRLSIR